MDIRVVRKDNLVSIAGNVFQCVDSASSDSVVATAVGGFVNIYDNINNRQITKNAAYESFKDERGNSLGVSATDVANTINSYIQSANPEQIIKATNKITDLARVEKFTTAKAGEFLAIGGTEDGAMVGSGYTADSFLQPGDNITVGDITAYGNITIPIGQGNLNVSGTIDAGGAIRSGSFLSGDYIRLEGSTDDEFETILQVVDPTQDNTITFPNTTGTVALTSDIPSGEIAVDSVDFDLTEPPSLVNGRLAYDVDKDTLIFQSEHGEIAIGETYKPVYNATGSTISKGAVLKATGVQGERFTVGLFDASSGVDEELYLIGVAQADIPDATEGVVVSEGYVKHLNTGSYSVGTILYASETPGAFTSTKPSPPNLGIPVAMVTKVDGTNGTIYVRLTQYSHLTEAHDVNISSPSNGQVLTYNGTSGVWENAAAAGGGGGIDTTGTIVTGSIPVFTDSDTVKGDNNLFVLGNTIMTSYNILAAGTLTVANISLGEASTPTPEISVSALSEDLKITSRGNVDIVLDSDTNETGQKFAVNDPSTTERFSVNDSGVVRINDAYSLPTADGTTGQVLTTNGSGAASWGDVSFLDLSDAPASYVANQLVSVNSSGDGLVLIEKRSPYAVDEVANDQNRLFEDPGLSTTSYRIVDFINDSLASASSSTAKNFLGWYDGSNVIIEGMVDTNSAPPSGSVAGNPIWLGSNGLFTTSPPTTSGDYSRVVGYYVGVQGGNALIYFAPSKDWIQIS